MEDYFFDNLPSPLPLMNVANDDVIEYDEVGALFRLFDVVSNPQPDIQEIGDDNSEEFEDSGSYGPPAPPVIDEEPKIVEEKEDFRNLFYPTESKYMDDMNYNKDEDDELEENEYISVKEEEEEEDQIGFQTKRVQPSLPTYQVFPVPRRGGRRNSQFGNNHRQPSPIPQDFFPRVPPPMANYRKNNLNTMPNLINRFQQPRRITGLSHQISLREYFSQWQTPVTNICKIWSPRPLQTYTFDVVNAGGFRQSSKAGLGKGMMQDSVITVLSERTDANKHLYISYDSKFLDQVVMSNGGWDNIRLFGFMREIYLTKERKVIQKFQAYHKGRNENNNSMMTRVPPPADFCNSSNQMRQRRGNNNNNNNNGYYGMSSSMSSKNGTSSPEDQFMIQEMERGCMYVASYQNFLRMNKSILRTPSECVDRVNNGTEYRFEVSLDRFNMNLVKVNSSSQLFAKRPFVEFALVLESEKSVVVSLFHFKYHGKETKRGQSKKDLKLSSFVFPKNGSVDFDRIFRDFKLGQERLWNDNDDEEAYSFKSNFVNRLDYERYNDVHGR